MARMRDNSLEIHAAAIEAGEPCPLTDCTWCWFAECERDGWCGDTDEDSELT